MEKRLLSLSAEQAAEIATMPGWQKNAKFSFRRY